MDKVHLADFYKLNLYWVLGTHVYLFFTWKFPFKTLILCLVYLSLNFCQLLTFLSKCHIAAEYVDVSIYA